MKRNHRLGLALGLGVSLSATAAGASTTQENHAKYTRLRQRLTTQFTVPGGSAGQSEPAQVRNDTQGWIKWADNSLYHGWYLGVLATEYYLRTHLSVYPGADNGDANAATKTLDDLYYALLAMERLDNVAEAAFPECTSGQQLNGFFVRDDVPGNFHQFFPPLTSTQSDFIDPTLTNKEMSQDQVYHALMGLAFVKQLVPASVTVRGKQLRSWAMAQARKIGEHVAKDNWVIKNPACGNRDVNRGKDAGAFSAGTSLALKFITDGAYAPMPHGLYGGLWPTFRSTGNPAFSKADNLHMVMSTAATGNGWGATTADDLIALSANNDWPIYSLIHRTLHGTAAAGFCTNGAAVNTRARTMLDELPNDGEPASPLPGPPASHGFTTNHRFTRPKAQHYVGSAGTDGQRYAATDYLLLHNVYAIATPATWVKGAGVAPCTGFDPAPAPGADGGTSGAPSSSGSSGASGAPPGSSSGDPSSASGGDSADEESSSGCAVAAADTSSTYGLVSLVGAVLALARLRMRRRSRE